MSSLQPPVAPTSITFIAEFIAALLSGLIGAILLYILTGIILLNTTFGRNLGMGVLTLQIYAAVLGAAAGAGGGAALVGRMLGQRGNVWLAILGAFIAGVLVAVVMRVFMLGGLFITLSIAIGLVGVGAVVGYNLRRRP